MTLPCVDRMSSSMISQDQTAFFSPQISGWFFFFLSRAVVLIMKKKKDLGEKLKRSLSQTTATSTLFNIHDWLSSSDTAEERPVA